MDKTSASEIKHIERKISSINDKLDRIVVALGVHIESSEQMNDQDEKIRKGRERQQAKMLQKRIMKLHIEKVVEDRQLKIDKGYSLQKQFNLAAVPSADRIREYIKTNNPNAFNGLKRQN